LELKDMTGLSEKCREIMAGNSDLAYCVVSDLKGTVLFANDQRYFGLPAQEPRLDRPVSQTRFSITVDGAEGSYYDNAVLITTPYGKPIALAHVGFSEKVVFDKVKGML